MGIFGYDHGEDEMMCREDRGKGRARWNGIVWAAAIGAILLLALLFLIGTAEAKESFIVRKDVIMKIESGGDVWAYNPSSRAKGLYQITPVVLREYNEWHPSRIIGEDEIFLPDRNERVAIWYLSERIPQMLVHFKKPVTARNILISYNAGIKYVVKNLELPEETSSYLQKYQAEMDAIWERNHP